MQIRQLEASTVWREARVMFLPHYVGLATEFGLKSRCSEPGSIKCYLCSLGGIERMKNMFPVYTLYRSDIKQYLWCNEIMMNDRRQDLRKKYHESHWKLKDCILNHVVLRKQLRLLSQAKFWVIIYRTCLSLMLYNLLR